MEDFTTLALHLIMIATGLCTIAAIVYGAGKVTGGNKEIVNMLFSAQKDMKENHNKLVTDFTKHVEQDDSNFKSLTAEITDVKISLAHAWPRKAE